MTAITRRLPAPGPAAPLIGTLRRSLRVVQRNAMVYRHSWIVIVSGFFEPLFYLLGIGYGLGMFVGEVTIRPGVDIPYAAFVAPGATAIQEAIDDAALPLALTLNIDDRGAVTVTLDKVALPFELTRHYASDLTDPSLPPMGLRFRLKRAYPIGGFSYSHGLEWAVEDGSTAALAAALRAAAGDIARLAARSGHTRLATLGVTDVRIPASPQRVWATIQEARTQEAGR